MDRFAVILGSTRPNRRGEPVARWVLEISSQRDDAEFELIDLRDYPLPHLDEPLPPRLRQYQNEHTKAWSETIASFDGFVVVTPEYNSGAAGVLKNALDYLFEEWRNKAIGFVSYGSMGGARAVQQLRLVAGELEMADVREQVALSLFTDFDGDESFMPNEHHIDALTTMLDQVISWSAALASLRAPQAAGAGGLTRSL
jgi:NAD(P)H-dependent FMN reductase